MKYRTIVADPPWSYPEGFVTVPDRPHAAARLSGKTGGTITRPALPYPSLAVAEISSIPVADLADRSARVFLWTTNRYLPDAFYVLAAWGFSYRQTLIWDKTPNIPPFGGSVAPNSAEFLLVGTRGGCPRLSRWQTSIIRARRGRTEHSRKPEVFLDLVEAVSPGPYLELFARRQRLGWDTYGNEALCHVDLEATT